MILRPPFARRVVGLISSRRASSRTYTTFRRVALDPSRTHEIKTEASIDRHGAGHDQVQQQVTTSDSTNASVLSRDPGDKISCERQNVIIDRRGREHDYYDYWLKLKWRPYRGGPGYWLGSLVPHTQDLPEPLRQDPLEALDHDGTDPTLTLLCLETFMARTRQDSYDLSQARKQYKSTRVGTRALLWFLRNGFDSIDITIEHRWIRVLAYCLVAQEQTSAILNWITVDYAPKYTANIHHHDRQVWRSRTFMMAVQATHYWANSTHSGLNNALAFFLQVMDQDTGNIVIDKGSAGDYILAALDQRDTSKVDVRMYERMMECRHWQSQGGGVSHAFHTARLQLFHPQGPRPEAAYHFIKDMDANRPDFWQTNDTQFDQGVAVFIAKAAQSLNGVGKTNEAREMLTIGLDNLPHYFKNVLSPRKQIYNPAAVDAVLKGRLSTGSSQSGQRRARHYAVREAMSATTSVKTALSGL